jgi:hypothetical protein
MKGLLTIKRKEKTAKRSERSKANPSAAERRAEQARKARSEKQAENGQPPVPYHKQWQRETTCTCAWHASGISSLSERSSRARPWAL